MDTMRSVACRCLAAVVMAVIATNVHGKVIYVDKAGHSGGTNWLRAYPSLDAALEASEPGDEIRIAQGTYKGLNYSYTRGFTINKTVTVKGGYAGLAGEDPDQCDIATYETILSGDINGDDGPDFTNTSDNSKNVLRIEGPIRPVIEGITITAGKGRITSGGGVYITGDAEPTLISCTLRGNCAGYGGAAGCSWDTTSKFISCLFVDNEAEEGGGAIDGRRATILLAHCTFISNHAVNRVYRSCEYGGAIHHAYAGRLEAIACNFYGNTAKVGGAIFTSRGSTTLRACTFSGNKASEAGGAVMSGADMCEIDGCSLVANSAGLAGGAVCSLRRCHLSNSILWANSAPSGSQISLIWPGVSYSTSDTPSISISFCDVEQGPEDILVLPEHSTSWGHGNLVTDPMFVQLPETDGDGHTLDGGAIGDLHLAVDSPCRDAGDPNTALWDSVDADGEPRVLAGRIDMGSDEYTSVPVALESVQITGPNEVHEEGQARFCLLGTFADGHTLDLSELAGWSLSPPEYGHLDPNGLLQLGGEDIDADLQILARYASNEGRWDTAKTIPYIPTHVTYHVDASNGDDRHDGLSRRSPLATIQQAIALTEDGDTIWTYPGIYAGPVDFLGKAITIQGRDGGASIDGQGYFGVICESGEGPNSILSNVVITNSYAAVFLAGSAPTIRYITAAGNRFGVTAYGGAAPDIRHSIFWDNSAADLVQCEAIYSCLANDENLLNVHTDPLFADPAANDYHLQSEAGRWEPTLGTWVQDAQSSPCIDAGYLPEPWDRELWPHGKRVNIGAYGNTPQASMSTRTVGHRVDLDHSGTVDNGDFAQIAQCWRTQRNLQTEDLDRNGIIDFSDLAILSDSWLAPEHREKVAFRDYWPLAVGAQWWHTDYVRDIGLNWEITRSFWIDDFKVWQFGAARNWRAGHCSPHDFYVYVDGALYRTSDPCELEVLPAPPGVLVAPEFVSLNEPFELPNYGKVWAIQGTLAEIVAQYRGDSHHSNVGQLSEFKGGNHDDVLAFATESISGLNPCVIYGRGFGPMLYSIFHLDGEFYVLAIVAPTSEDALTRADIVTIQAEPYEDYSTVATVEFSDTFATGKDSTSTETIGRDTDGQDGWSCPWPYPNWGKHTLTAKAFDAEGQVMGKSREVRVEVSWGDPRPELTIIEPNGTSVAEDPEIITIEVEFSHRVVDGMWVEFQEVCYPAENHIIGQDRDPGDGWILHWTDHADSLSHTLIARMMFGNREIVRSDPRWFCVSPPSGRSR